MTVTVTIGRNVKGTPMKYAAWKVFRDDTCLLVKGYAPVIYFAGEGDGVWGDSYEGAYAVVFEKPSPHEVLALMVGLGNLAKRYNQEAIAWTDGETQMLGR